MPDEIKVRQRTKPKTDLGGGPIATPEMIKLAGEIIRANKAANAANTIVRNGKKSLMELIVQGGTDLVDALKPSRRGFATKIDDKMVDCFVGPTEKKVVDLDVLEKLVDAKTFRIIVSATQGAVKDHAGNLVLSECLKTEAGDDDITVKERK